MTGYAGNDLPCLTAGGSSAQATEPLSTLLLSLEMLINLSITVIIQAITVIISA